MLEPVIVADSGPLIALGSIARLEILRDLHRDVLVPEAVYAEVVECGAARPGADRVSRATWLQRVRVDPRPDAFLLEELGAGEAEAIALASRGAGVLLLIDEIRGRRIAETIYHLRVRGVVGTLALAKKEGLVSALRPLLELMVQNGYRLHEHLIEAACRALGE